MSNSKRDEIINSIINMTIKKGYFCTSITKIVEEAGISKGSFYTYFKSKDFVFIEILQKRLEEIIFEHKIITKASSSFDMALKYFLTTKINLKSETQKIELVIFNLTKNIEDLEPQLKEQLKKIEAENINFIESLLNKFLDELKIDKEDIGRYSQLIYMIIRDFKILNFISIKENLKNSKSDELTDESSEKDADFIYNSILKLLK